MTEQSLRGKAVHLDRKLNNWAGAIDFETFSFARNGNNIQVDFLSESLVQSQFFLAESLAASQRGVVEERVLGWLFDFVGVVARK